LDSTEAAESPSTRNAHRQLLGNAELGELVLQLLLLGLGAEVLPPPLDAAQPANVLELTNVLRHAVRLAREEVVHLRLEELACGPRKATKGRRRGARKQAIL